MAKRFSFFSTHERETSAFLILATVFLTYAPLLPYLGFYRDDWYLIWTAQAKGAQGILSLFAGDRPFLGWLYIFDYTLLGNTPWHWHIYALFIKTIGVFSFWWLLRSLWPEKKIETTLMTLLFAVYPGFYQEPNAATFKNLLLAYSAAMASLAFTIHALKAKARSRKFINITAALLLMLIYIFIYEALIGIEVIRVILIWYFLSRKNFKDWASSLSDSMRASAPYLLVGLSFVFWRIFLFHSTRRATNVAVVLTNFNLLSIDGMIRFVVEFGRDLIETSLLAWGVPYYQFSYNTTDYRNFLLIIFISLIVVVLVNIYRSIMETKDNSNSTESSTISAEKDWLILGAISIFVTTLPIILAGRNVIFSIQWDRYTYQSLVGIALLMGGIIFYGLRGRLRWILLSLLLVSGISTQLFSANYYRKFWSVEKNAMWQLSWRAPQIADGTTLVASFPNEYALAEEYEVWGPVNLFYRSTDSISIPGQAMYEGIWVDLALGTQQNRTVRDTITINRNLDLVVILSQPSVFSCLHVLDGNRPEQTVTERPDVRIIAKYSNVSFINETPNKAVYPTSIFGAEPPHDWCFFYQKMDLARQTLQWQKGADLADQAIAQGLEPNDVSEWLPALEAYIHTGNLEKTKRIALLIRVQQDVYHGICQQLKVLYGQPAKYDRDLLFDNLCRQN